MRKTGFYPIDLLSWVVDALAGKCSRRMLTQETKKGERKMFTEKIADGSPAPCAQSEDRELVHRARQGDTVAFAELVTIYRDRVKHRAVIVLKDLENLQYSEIAETLECSIGTIMSRLFHARRKLQILLRSANLSRRLLSLIFRPFCLHAENLAGGRIYANLLSILRSRLHNIDRPETAAVRSLEFGGPAPATGYLV
jgi:sigma-70-like protein